MITRQDQPGGPVERPQFYASCENVGCGVCGPVRATSEEAEADDAAHQEVCSARANALAAGRFSRR